MASRAFSSTSAAAAADVKSLGVIGSGQMVSLLMQMALSVV